MPETFFNTIPTASASFLDDLTTFLKNEDADRFHEQFTDYVESGGLHGTVAGLVGTPSALTAYPAGHRITESGSITYPDATSYVWVIANKATTGDAGGFTRVAGTHYLIQSAGAQPALPSGAIWLMQVTTAAGAITAVTDLRTLSAVGDLLFNDAGGDPTDVGLATADGTATTASRRDHVHRTLRYLPLLLTNKTGVSNAAGDVVALDTGNDSAVVLGDVAASVAEFVVAVETVANNATGMYARMGYVSTLKVTGTVVRGNYLVKSATTKVAADSGVAESSSATRPAGAFAVALTADAAGAVAAVLLGVTETTKPTVGGIRESFRGLQLRTHPDADKALTTVQLIAADEIVLSGGSRVADWSFLTAAITTAGYSGLDTGAEAASVWYEIHAIYAPAGPVPSAPTAAEGVAGNVDIGTHRWKITFLSASGESIGGTASSQLNPATAVQVELSAIPLGPPGTTTRRVYRTATGDTGDFKFVGAIGDNTTTTFSDNVADSGLGAVVPAADGFGGTKALMLHRAKDYFADETSTAGEDTTHILRSGATTNIKLGQSFKVDTTGALPFVDVKLIKSGTPAGGTPAVWFTIEADTAGAPSGTALATSDKLDATAFSTTAITVRFPFRTPATLTAATTYWLVLQGDYTVSGANYIGWRADGSAGAYANGTKSAYDGTTWTADADDDFIFTLYITRNDAALTFPGGFTESALLGYVYNSSGSNLVPFVAQDRSVVPLARQNIASVTATVPLLVDLSAFLPPCPVHVSFFASVGSGTYHNVAFAGVPDGFVAIANVSTNQRLGGEQILWVSYGQNNCDAADLIDTLLQGAYVLVTTDTVVVDMNRWEW
jgi:hypothetical protein